MDYKLFEWQEQALSSWKDNNFKGTVKASTGSGKTRLALAAINNFKIKPSVLIVVPTIELQRQWVESLVESGCPENMIGLVGDGKKEWSKKFVVGIINSVRDSFHSKQFIILDEVHHYMSSENIKVFGRDYKFLLCLSATPERLDSKHELLYEIAPIVYDYDLASSVSDNITNSFKLINVGIVIPEQEMHFLKQLDNKIREGQRIYGNNLYKSFQQGDFKARIYMSAQQKRKSFLWNHPEKISKAVATILSHENDKTIVFCDYIKTANNIVRELKNHGVIACLYHSSLKDDKKQESLEDFKTGKHNIIVTVKCFDEGVNVPDADIGVIVGGGGNERQMIQRTGRLLRNRPGKKPSIIYQYFVRDSQDEVWLARRSKALREAAMHTEFH